MNRDFGSQSSVMMLNPRTRFATVHNGKRKKQGSLESWFEAPSSRLFKRIRNKDLCDCSVAKLRPAPVTGCAYCAAYSAPGPSGGESLQTKPHGRHARRFRRPPQRRGGREASPTFHGPPSSPLKNAIVAFFNLAKCGTKSRTARKITTCVAILSSHPCDVAARRLNQRMGMKTRCSRGLHSSVVNP